MAAEPTTPSAAELSSTTRRTSGWAIASLTFSLLGVLPLCVPAALIGPLMGFRALWVIRKRRDRGGAALAKTAIVIGVIVTAAYTWGIWWWAANVRPLYIYGPRDALIAGVNRGDVAAFQAHFTGEGAAASSEQARSFLDELSQRHGRFVRSYQHLPARREATMEEFFHPVVTYALVFERRTVEAEAHLIVRDERGNWLLALRSITVYDPDFGDLHYPANAPLPPAATPSSNSPNESSELPP